MARATNTHTPGPWQLYSEGDINEITDAKGVPVVQWKGFDDSRRKPSEHRANARLITAAPELNDSLLWTAMALQSLVNAGKIHEDAVVSTGGERRTVGEILDGADAVLAKAKGNPDAS